MAKATCSIEGCERPSYRRGLCAACHSRWRRTSPDRPRCIVDGCEDPAIARGWCNKHYLLWKSNGVPEHRPRPVITEKRCCICRQVLPVSEFYQYKNGLQTHCKACGRNYRREHYRRTHPNRRTPWTPEK